MATAYFFKAVAANGKLRTGTLSAETDKQVAQELKRQGTTVEEAGKILSAELKTRYPDWPNLGPVPNIVRRVYAEN